MAAKVGIEQIGDDSFCARDAIEAVAPYIRVIAAIIPRANLSPAVGFTTAHSSLTVTCNFESWS